VAGDATAAGLRAALGERMPAQPTPARQVLDELVAAASPGLVHSQSPRYFGFVIGGALPVAIAADWMASTWDQNAVMFATSPAAAVVEDLVGEWVRDLLGLPATASFASVTGTQMAHVTALAAARHHVLAAAGWDVGARGLRGAPEVRILVSSNRHVTIDRAARLLGFGSEDLVAIPTDPNGRMDPDALEISLGHSHAPTIVCVQAGDVNSGGFDSLEPIISAARLANAWVHVDGAFGLWAAASDSHRHLLRGVELADSWATDLHKWLNVPYDSGLVYVSRPSAHTTAMAASAAYLTPGQPGERDQMDWSPELSRRARTTAAFAALRALGRSGVAELVERSCACAQRFAELLDGMGSARVMNEIELNQVLVRFGDDDERTEAVAQRVRAEGVCWLHTSTWRSQRVVRISVCNAGTTLDDVERSAAAILAADRAIGGLPRAPAGLGARP
jgi:glutamate/tyrosine decarboxylase-like PLP-dependent enzyme